MHTGFPPGLTGVSHMSRGGPPILARFTNQARATHHRHHYHKECRDLEVGAERLSMLSEGPQRKAVQTAQVQAQRRYINNHSIAHTSSYLCSLSRPSIPPESDPPPEQTKSSPVSHRSHTVLHQRTHLRWRRTVADANGGLVVAKNKTQRQSINAPVAASSSYAV